MSAKIEERKFPVPSYVDKIVSFCRKYIGAYVFRTEERRKKGFLKFHHDCVGCRRCLCYDAFELEKRNADYWKELEKKEAEGRQR